MCQMPSPQPAACMPVKLQHTSYDFGDYHYGTVFLLNYDTGI